MRFFKLKKVYVPLGLFVLLGIGLVCFRFLAPDEFSLFYLVRIEPTIEEFIKRAKFKATDYFVAQTIVLDPAKDRPQGELRVLQDKQLVGRKDTKTVGDPSEEINTVYKPAVLEWVAQNGKVVDKKILDHAFVSIEGKVDLYGDGRAVYKVVEDANIGMGSHSGFVVSFLELTKGRMDIWGYFMSSLKEGWKLVPAKTGKGQDILQVACWPTGGEDFEITYTRYSFDGKSWVTKENTAKGMWEGEDDTPDGFPEVSKFP